MRRAVVAIGIVCGASAAGALAFASEISRAGVHLVERATWRGRGFTAVPAAGAVAHGDGIIASPNETPQGEFCRFPPRNASDAVPSAPLDTLLGDSIGSAPRLVLDGQSRIPDALPPALCTGDTTKPPIMPRLAKP